MNMTSVPFSAQELMKWSGAVFFALVEAYVVYGIAFKWDMRRLLCAEDGAASMSRFQLLLFTFAIGGGYFYLLLQRGAFPAVDPGAMALLGISGGTYAISKGIQASRDTTMSSSQGPAPDQPPAAGAAPGARAMGVAAGAEVPPGQQ
jgi:hypothetical protein